MAHVIHRDYPEVVSVQPNLSLEERLKGLVTTITLGSRTLMKEGEVLHDLPGEYRVRLYELEYAADDDSMRFDLPIEGLDDLDGYSRSSICHLLAFRELHPELQMSTPLWAPGESFVRGGTQSIGLSEIRAARGGVITSTERVEPAYGNLRYWTGQDKTKNASFGLNQFRWLHNKAALYVKRI